MSTWQWVLAILGGWAALSAAAFALLTRIASHLNRTRDIVSAERASEDGRNTSDRDTA